MFEIWINGKKIYISEGTTTVSELNNNINNFGKIEGDIAYTFDVPVHENSIIFEHAEFEYVKSAKKYKCRIAWNGIFVSEGNLYLQKITQRAYSVGLVFNPFPAKFPDKAISTNEFDTIIISKDLAQHFNNWRAFFIKTLDEDSIVRFPLFRNPELYGSDNPNFGFFFRIGDDGNFSDFQDIIANGGDLSGFQASLKLDDNIALEKYYVNRLFFGKGTDGIYTVSSSRGFRLWNDVYNYSSFTFCPAIHLLYVLQQVIKAAGYILIGNIINDYDFKNILIQSLRTVDGLVDDYFNYALAVVSCLAIIGETQQLLTDPKMYYGVNKEGDYDQSNLFNLQGSFIPLSSGNYTFRISVKFFCNFDMNPTINYYAQQEPENNYYWTDIETIDKFVYIGLIKNNLTSNNPGVGYITIEEITGVQQGNLYEREIMFSVNITEITEYKFVFGLFKRKTYEDKHPSELRPIAISWETLEGIPVISDLYVIQGQGYSYNMFTNYIKISDYLPNVTNSEFINNIRNAFGLTFFINSESKQIEMSYIKDILKAYKTINLTPYLLNRQTTINIGDFKTYKYTLSPLEDIDEDSESFINPVQTFEDLPDALRNFGKTCFVVRDNRYYRSEKVGDAVQIWIYKWSPIGGNNSEILVNEDDDQSEEDVNPDKIFIPGVARISEQASPYFIADIPEPGMSPLFSKKDSKPLEKLILLKYLGRQNLYAGSSMDIQSASPVCFDPNNKRLSGTDLTTDGIGNTYIAPWLEFIANNDTVTHQFLLPPDVFLQCKTLTSPQNVEPKEQLRWVIVNSVKLLPVKMTFEFIEGKDLVKAQIEFIRECPKI